MCVCVCVCGVCVCVYIYIYIYLCMYIYIYIIYYVCSVLKRRGDYVETCPRCFGVEYTWSVCRNLAGGFFSTDVF